MATRCQSLSPQTFAAYKAVLRTQRLTVMSVCTKMQVLPQELRDLIFDYVIDDLVGDNGLGTGRFPNRRTVYPERRPRVQSRLPHLTNPERSALPVLLQLAQAWYYNTTVPITWGDMHRPRPGRFDDHCPFKLGVWPGLLFTNLTVNIAWYRDDRWYKRHVLSRYSMRRLPQIIRNVLESLTQGPTESWKGTKLILDFQADVTRHLEYWLCVRTLMGTLFPTLKKLKAAGCIIEARFLPDIVIGEEVEFSSKGWTQFVEGYILSECDRLDAEMLDIEREYNL